MTKHTPISRDGAAEAKGKGGSLFERAGAAYGLKGLGAASVPKNLPRPKTPVQQPVAKAHAPAVAPAPQSSPADTAPVAALEEPAVILGGDFVEIDREALREHHLIVPEDPVMGLLEEFRIIKRELLADARGAHDPAARRVLLSSPHEGEGKTFCAANLAIALAAERDIEVLLIDSDVMN
ncbi:MAG: capsular biosynthesis protein, partial [Erythrobacter sp.]|nr:capsular biosynthesis protein [Erythrobacter sp.]